MALMAWDIVFCVVCGLIATAIILGNAFCIAVLRGVQNMRNPTKLLTASISVADLCSGAFVVLPVIVTLATEGYLLQIPGLCTLSAFATTLFPRAAIACNLAANLDRFVAIWKPLRYREIVTTRRAYIALAVIWAMSLILTSFLGFLEGSSTLYHPQFHMCFFTHRSTVRSSFMPAAVLFFVSVFVPIVISVVIYLLIARIARDHRERIVGGVRMNSLPGAAGSEKPFGIRGCEPGSAKPNAKAKPTVKAKPNAKASNTFLLVTGGFVVAWLPFLVILLHEGLKKTVVPRWLANLSQLAVFSSSWWNVLIFYIRNRSFRRRAGVLFHVKNYRANNGASK